MHKYTYTASYVMCAKLLFACIWFQDCLPYSGQPIRELIPGRGCIFLY